MRRGKGGVVDFVPGITYACSFKMIHFHVYFYTAAMVRMSKVALVSKLIWGRVFIWR